MVSFLMCICILFDQLRCSIRKTFSFSIFFFYYLFLLLSPLFLLDDTIVKKKKNRLAEQPGVKLISDFSPKYFFAFHKSMAIFLPSDDDNVSPGRLKHTGNLDSVLIYIYIRLHSYVINLLSHGLSGAGVQLILYVFSKRKKKR